MSRFPRARWWWALLPLSAFAFLFPPGCGDDETGPSGPVVLPAAWAGVWEIETIERDCGSSVIDFQESETDTLCAGEEISFAPDDADSLQVSCDGTVTDIAVDVTCTTSTTVEGVAYTVLVEVAIDRNGDSMSGTVRYTVRAGDTVVECFEEELTGTRIGPAPDPCDDSSSTFPSRRARSVIPDVAAHR